MNKFKLSVNVVLTTLILQMPLMKTVIAQPTDGGLDNSGSISTGGFSGGTFNFPIDGFDGFGGLGGGLGDLLPEPIADLFKDITNIVGQVETFLSELGIEVSPGDLGLPDILQAIELFESDNQIDIASDVFGTQTGSTKVIDDSLYKQYLKDMANQYAQNSTLSEEGQKNTTQQLEIAGQTAQISNLYAEDSNGQDVSQNILRNISNQLALQQQLDNMNYFGQTEDKVARSLMLSMHGESLVALDKLTTTRDREATSTLKLSTYHQGLLSIPAQHLIQ